MYHLYIVYLGCIFYAVLEPHGDEAGDWRGMAELAAAAELSLARGGNGAPSSPILERSGAGGQGGVISSQVCRWGKEEEKQNGM